ncbi:MAG: SGNH/GDSL hydrolase family protein [Clostridia bacterium]|nr:SGNH/GDSL hydrolase family protein [Clostridia bacterium]
MTAILLATAGCTATGDEKTPITPNNDIQPITPNNDIQMSTQSPLTPNNDIQMSTQSPLMNTYKLLNNEKKLTIGYLGGSITLGTSAGDITKSWVNRVSSWFGEQFPDATIETVNAGVSDTATNFGIYRLRNDLMNTNGHDMPDLVFVEFTNNDFIYASQNEDDLKLQIESLILNIWGCNPNAEIIAISTSTSRVPSRTMYQSLFEKYNLTFIDVGYPLRKKMREKKSDTEGKIYYYTTDNLHPSARGYEVYLDEIVKVIKPYLTNLAPKDKNLTDYNKSKPVTESVNLILSPKVISADKLKHKGAAKLTDSPISFSQFGTALTRSTVQFTASSIHLSGESTITAEFSGSALGVVMQLDKVGFEMRWKVDGGEWKEFAVNDKSWPFQRYNHPQVFMMEHNLSQDKHTVVIEFSKNTDVRLGGILVNE